MLTGKTTLHHGNEKGEERNDEKNRTGDENGVYELEYEYIKKLYAKRLEKNDFLTSYGGHDPEEEVNADG